MDPLWTKQETASRPVADGDVAWNWNNKKRLPQSNLPFANARLPARDEIQVARGQKWGAIEGSRIEDAF
jgi:hypothetical protein